MHYGYVPGRAAVDQVWAPASVSFLQSLQKLNQLPELPLLFGFMNGRIGSNITFPIRLKIFIFVFHLFILANRLYLHQIELLARPDVVVPSAR